MKAPLISVAINGSFRRYYKSCIAISGRLIDFRCSGALIAPCFPGSPMKNLKDCWSCRGRSHASDAGDMPISPVRLCPPIMLSAERITRL